MRLSDEVLDPFTYTVICCTIVVMVKGCCAGRWQLMDNGGGGINTTAHRKMNRCTCRKKTPFTNSYNHFFDAVVPVTSLISA